MINMASGMVHGCVHLPMKTLHNMMAVWAANYLVSYIIDIGHPCYGQLTAVNLLTTLLPLFFSPFFLVRRNQLTDWRLSIPSLKNFFS